MCFWISNLNYFDKISLFTTRKIRKIRNFALFNSFFSKNICYITIFFTKIAVISLFIFRYLTLCYLSLFPYLPVCLSEALETSQLTELKSSLKYGAHTRVLLTPNMLVYTKARSAIYF